MNKFDLGDAGTKSLIADTISGLVSQTQLEMQNISGKGIFLVKNTPIINTAIDKADDSLRYHGIPQESISNEKKFAHICFWMLKLSPISYTIRPHFWGGRISPTDHSIDIPADFKHVAVNALIAFKTFIAFYCMSRYADDAPEHIESIVKNRYSNEVIKSLMFHNYSARSMAMFLETLMMGPLH